ncbi:hypothetical protein [Xanthomonas phaseoli]|uniref:Cobalamin ABC transporter n=1 Tax=Xanthomonas phaseoli pv. dieffenbachiae TaxID=92828 RepID=A0A1V9HEA1_9XANT|nr:hypothetical protein [Xanthomonas phaseoli]MBO9789967.1 hypothetical protein [Xanthomonas phaseoli pv. dieffenbachiae]MBO9834265.1 hypothetical protein [Xanthomonas phaseoli pv. dieffenbachiae]MBO9836695.1 hypothetical protein [Xanthomonas phaseoli pv. dieffenbachiae]MBO9841953.1 hypothetical protein [Xanthomonas phaseoli pv. dieffenbachiae]MBO9852760.1 hypothetical protein [Xanthomonas phaseoli pv. dieffenbachiae]
MMARRAAATPLPLHGSAARACGIALAGLMVCARGEHFAHADALPTASWAVFFLAGALLRPLWMLPLLFGIVSLLDLIGLASGSSSDWCLSPAYWALALAYAVLWWGGLLFASQLQRQAWRRVTRPLLALLISGSTAYVLSKAGFYFLSGRYPHATLSGFIAHMPADYPHALATLAGYVGLAFALLAAHRAAGARPPMGARA